MKQKLFLALLGTILFTTSCQQSNDFKNSNTLHLNLRQDPATLDPRCARNLLDITLATQLFEGLIRLDSQGKETLALAKEIHLSEDNLTYTFILKDAFWSNGSPITSHDFVYAWRKVLNPSFATDYAHILFVVKNGKKAKTKQCAPDEIAIFAIDDKTFQVTLENPTPYFLSLLSFPVTFPICRGLDEQNSNWMLSEKSLICSGPFKINTWQKSFSLLLEKNEFYWDKNNVHLHNIDFTVINDPATESYLFEKGELDWLGQPLSREIFSELLCQLKQEGKLLSYDVSGTYMLKFQTEKEPFNDPKLRKAFSYAISRNKIIDHILQGNQKIATGLLPPSLQLHDTPYFKDENLSDAKQLFEEFLQERKITREKFPRVVISFSLSERNSKIVQLLQEMWQNAFDIKIELNGAEMQCFRQKLKAGEFHIATGDWIADYQDPISFLEIFQCKVDDKKGASLNETRWYNANFANLLDTASVERNPQIRLQMLHKAEQILMNEMPIAPIYHYSFDYVKKDTIKNVILSPLGIADYKYVEIEKR